MLGEAALVAALVGLSLVAGAVVAARVKLSTAAGSGLTAFGGGLLLAAVALELVPEADARAGAAITAVGLLVGTGVYVFADWRLHHESAASKRRHAVHAAATGRMMMPEGSQEGRSDRKSVV